MDVDYSKNLDESGQPVSDYLHSLFVLSTVQSVAVRHIGFMLLQVQELGVIKVFNS